MIKRELRSLLLNPIMIIVLAAILLIPSIYTVPFLSSMWDPYGRLSELPVAVVNEDQPVNYKEKQLSVGDDLVSSLKDNDSLDFCFVDAKKAERGLQDNTYYMTITIPKDFSANAATVMDETPKEMELQYKTNPGTNYIASKLCTTAMEKIRTSVSEEVSKTYTEAVFDGFDDIASGMDDAADGADEMLDGETKLIGGSRKMTEGIGELASGSTALYTGAKTLQSGVSEYTAGVAAVDTGVNSLGSGVIQFKQETGKGAAQLQKGAKSLQSGVSAYTAGVSKAKSGVLQLADNSKSLNDGMSALSEGTAQLASGSKTLSGGLTQMQKQVASGLKTAQEEQIPALQKSMNDFGSSLKTLNGLVQNYEPGASSRQAQPAKQTADVSDLQGDLDTVKAQLAKLDAEDQDEDRAAAIAEISRAVDDMENKIDAAASSQQAAAPQAEPKSGGQELAAIRQLTAGLNQNYTALQGAVTGGMGQMVSGYKTVNDTLSQAMIPGASQLTAGLTKMNQDVDGTLVPGVKKYTDGVSGVSAGLSAITAKNKELNGGAGSLGAGVSALAGGISGGADALGEGISQLSEGTGKLTANSGELNSGTGALADGAQQIHSGTSQLETGSKALGSGLASLKDGTGELKKGLKDGKKDVKKNKADEESIDMMTKPVELNGKEEHPVPDNGHAMAAYMMSVALWVGALAFCLMYPLTKHRGRLTSGFNWWLSKAMVLYPLAIGMALTMLGLLHKFCGFQPYDWKNTILLACIAALAFMSMMYFFNAWLGRVGSFIMLIFMIVQLSGSAGTYPIELSGDFVADINPFLPFSYTVAGFRSTISGCEANLAPCYIMLLLIMIVFTALSILLFLGRTKKIKAGKPTFHDFMDSRGFA